MLQESTDGLLSPLYIDSPKYQDTSLMNFNFQNENDHPKTIIKKPPPLKRTNTIHISLEKLNFLHRQNAIDLKDQQWCLKRYMLQCAKSNHSLLHCIPKYCQCHMALFSKQLILDHLLTSTISMVPNQHCQFFSIRVGRPDFITSINIYPGFEHKD